MWCTSNIFLCFRHISWIETLTLLNHLEGLWFNTQLLQSEQTEEHTTVVHQSLCSTQVIGLKLSKDMLVPSHLMFGIS